MMEFLFFYYSCRSHHVKSFNDVIYCFAHMKTSTSNKHGNEGLEKTETMPQFACETIKTFILNVITTRFAKVLSSKKTKHITQH